MIWRFSFFFVVVHQGQGLFLFGGPEWYLLKAVIRYHSPKDIHHLTTVCLHDATATACVCLWRA